MSQQSNPITGVTPLAPRAAKELLEEVINRARARAPRSIVVFDLDSTLLDNSHRQARIMREYGREHSVPALCTVTGEHWDGWDAKLPMKAAGLSPDQIKEHFAPFRSYWRDRFFTSEFCLDDRPIAGAVRYVGDVLSSKSQLFYVTGRHEPMREGTVESFKSAGFPVPNGENIRLLMKPSLEEHDDDYKVRTYALLTELGDVVAAFDNEPTHINGYREAFPEALSIHLATDQSPRGIKVQSGIPSISDFAAWL